MKIEDLGEFGLIRRIQALFPVGSASVQGIGDDCAVLPWSGDESLLVTTDMLVENTHFLLRRISARDLGHKALAVNLSDLAAKGGAPLAAFLSLGLPPGTEAGWLDSFFDGLAALSRASGCPLLGGDTTRSQAGLVINLAVLGRAASGRIKLRSAARPGDILAVTGMLGDSAAGLRLLLAGSPLEDPAEKALVEAHHHPRAHLAEGHWLSARPEVRAMMDVSDGVDSDLHRILEASGAGADVDLDALPLSAPLRDVCARRSWNASELAATGGEDYCLLCTVAPAAYPEVARAFQEAFGRPLPAIGRMTAEGGLTYRRAGAATRLAGHGFEHFR